MLKFIQGTVAHIDSEKSTITLNVNGFGVEAMVSDAVTVRVNAGEDLRLYTFLAFTGERVSLYAFERIEELELFEVISSVKGIGGKSALSIMNTVSLAETLYAIENESIAIIAQAPGIGKKTAERLIFELKPKLKKLQKKFVTFPEKPENNGHEESSLQYIVAENNEELKEVRSVLSSLGYSRQEIAGVINNNIQTVNVANTEEFLKKCLSELNKIA